MGLLENLSIDLSLVCGKGFSLSNIKRKKQIYVTFPIGATVSHQLIPAPFTFDLSVGRLFRNLPRNEVSFYAIELANANLEVVFNTKARTVIKFISFADKFGETIAEVAVSQQDIMLLHYEMEFSR